MKIFIQQIWLLLLPFLSVGQDCGEKIDAYLKQEYKNGVAPGFAAVVVQGEEVIFSRGYGVERSGAAEPMTVNSISGIASITKSLTTLAVMKLVEAGKVDLDAPVTRYLPWFRTANKERSDRITVRMLLNNTAALPAIYSNKSGDLTDRALEENVRALSAAYLSREPGLSYEYSNQGFTVAGLVIARASGMSYRNFMEQEIFHPMAMKNTSIDPGQFDELQALYGHAPGADGPIPSAKPAYSGEFIPAGSLTRSSAADMGHYLQMLLNGGEFKGRQIITPESLEEIFKPQAAFPGLSYEQGGEGKVLHYGLGWMMGEVDGSYYLLHGGSAGTMSALLVMEPATKTGAVILFNYDLTFVDTYRYTSEMTMLNNVIRLANGRGLSRFGIPRIEDPTGNDYRLPDELKERYIGYYDLRGASDHFLLRGADLVIRKSSAGEIEAAFVLGGAVVFSARLDFVNESLALTRNVNQPVRIRFSVQPGGEVQKAFFDGALPSVYQRRTEAFIASCQRIDLRSMGIAFLLPMSWEVQRRQQCIHATSGEGTLQIFDAPSFENQDEKAVIGRSLPEYEVVRTGRMHAVQWKETLWQQMSLDLLREGRAYQACLLWTKDEPNAPVILLRTPAGRLTAAIQEMLEPMMGTMERW